jgi:hypothetical protein
LYFSALSSHTHNLALVRVVEVEKVVSFYRFIIITALLLGNKDMKLLKREVEL